MDGYGKRILVVDDDENTALLMSTLLERSGYNVTAVSNGAEALRELGRRHFDAVVTDYVMPVLNGAELLKLVQAQYPDTPVIFVSGHPSEYLDAIDPPPFARIRKPFESEALLKLVRSAVHVPTTQTAVSF
ncbi:MAG TPA: response regulator [Nitrospira sp.]|nr:response regulator [Nitrospira sp.]